MGRKLILAAALAVAMPVTAWTIASAQTDDAGEKSWFVTYVEQTISTPDRKISLGRIDGALSSDVKISSITIADRQGVWLTIEGAHLIWSRTALLTGKLDIDLLEAQSIAVTRKPLPPEGIQPASSGFSVPELPVSVKLTKLSVPTVSIAAAIAGADTVLSVEGGADVANGTMHADLSVKRTRPSGGELVLKADYSNTTRQLGLDLSLQEPKDGFLSTMLSLPGRPAIGFTIAGTGPLDNFSADIGLSADGDKLLSGKAVISQGDTGLIFTTDLNGTLSRLVQPAYADFVAGASNLSIAAHQTADGGLSLDHANIRSGVMALALSGAISPDGFPTKLSADGRIGADDGRPVRLPGAAATIGGARLAASFGDGAWTATFDLAKLQTDTIAAGTATIHAGGEARDLVDAKKRSLTYTVTGRAEDLTASDAGLQQALGKTLDFEAGGAWQAAQPVAIDKVRLASAGAQASFAGKLDGNDLSGRYTLSAPDLSLFSGLAGRDLRGKAELEANGTLALVGGAMTMTIDGGADDLALGQAAADALMKGHTALKGGLRRAEDGLHLDKLDLANDQLHATLDGLYGVKQVGLQAQARLADVKLLTDRASGAATLTAALTGDAEAPAVRAELVAETLTLQGKPFRNGRAGFAGTLRGADVDGQFSLSGDLDKLPVTASAKIETLPDGTRRLSGLDASAGAASLSGDLTLQPRNLVTGSLAANVPDMAAIAPLLLITASGSLVADVALTVEDGRQDAGVKAQAKSLKIETTTVGSADIDLNGTDLLGVPGLAGKADARAIQLGSFAIRQVLATAEQRGGATAFRVQGDMPRGSVKVAGALTGAQGGFDVRLDTLDVRQEGVSAALAAPVTIASRAEGITIPKALLRIGQGGTVSIAGLVGQRLALDAVVTALPASLANIASPGLGASGMLSATAKVTGTGAAPVADFEVRGESLSANALRGVGLTPLQLAAKGHFANRTVALDATVSGAGGLSVKARGNVPLAGGGLAVDVQASAPLALANAMMVERADKLTGTLTLDARVTGALAEPAVSGRAVVAGGTFTDPDSGMKLTGIGGSVRFDGQRATIEQFAATTPGGGTLGLRGSVGLKPDYPADLAITLRNAKLSDGNLATVQLSGDMTVRGGLTGQPVIGGRISIARAEITIPERFPANAALLGVKHLATPPEVLRTLAKAKIVNGGRKGKAGKAGGPSNIVLDLTIDAPSKIFVRGRGLDTELGGELKLTGPISNVSPVGSFQMRRGSLDVIGQHINFDSGSVVLTGDLNPTIDFVATTRNSSITVTARVTGQASDPQIVLSSVPELPQDEVMAQFLFGHSISDLSPFQIVQLATAVAQLAGGSSGPDLLGSIRKSTGLDNLGIVTDAQGNAAVQAGSYITDKVYLGVTTGARGDTNAAINLDITKNLKLRGETGTDGSKAGVFYEREY